MLVKDARGELPDDTPDIRDVRRFALYVEDRRRDAKLNVEHFVARRGINRDEFDKSVARLEKYFEHDLLKRGQVRRTRVPTAAGELMPHLNSVIAHVHALLELAMGNSRQLKLIDGVLANVVGQLAELQKELDQWQQHVEYEEAWSRGKAGDADAFS